MCVVAYDREPLSTVDANGAEWVATSLPRVLELAARPFSWLGGWVGITALTFVSVVLLARERNWLDVAFVLAVVVGSQAAVALLKAWFDRPRPDAGSAVPLPESAAFPSGHAASGVAVLGAFTDPARRADPERARTHAGSGSAPRSSASRSASLGSR